MKKILCVLMICLSLVITKPLLAGTCEGGTEFQGVVNGHTYCRSKVTMSWWSAFSWCKKQGRKLASLQQLCINWDGGTATGLCHNMKGEETSVMWSSNPKDASSAFYVSSPSGNINHGNRLSCYGNYAYAVCY